MSEKAKDTASSIKEKVLGSDNAGSSNPLGERAATQTNEAKAEDKSSEASSTVKAELNPALVGYGYTHATLPSGDEVAAGKAKEVSQEDFDNAGQLKGFDKLVKADSE